MRLLLASMARLIFATGIILTAIAIVIGRHQVATPELRSPAISPYQAVSDHLFQSSEPGVHLLDTRSGVLERIRLPDADRIEYAACSPWRDSQGRVHLIGLWKELQGSHIRSMGLARYALPGGEVLDRVVMDVIPGSPLCWYPGTSLRVLFAGWDGQLYQLSFDPAESRPGSQADDPQRPRPLRWRIPPLNLGRFLLADPTWPSDPRLGAKIIASVIFVQDSDLERPRTRTQLWWFRLGADGSAVEEAGRLIVPEPSDPGKSILEERLPSIATTPAGDLVLAYLVRRSGDLTLQLRLAPLSIDRTTGVPQVDESDAVDLAGGRASSPPIFSQDGRWVYTIPRTDRVPQNATRFSVTEVLASRPGTLAHDREGWVEPAAESLGAAPLGGSPPLGDLPASR